MYIPITMIITLKNSASSASQPYRRFDNCVTFTTTTTCLHINFQYDEIIKGAQCDSQFGNLHPTCSGKCVFADVSPSL